MSGYTISKDFHFSASHQLMGLEEGHQCGRVHGHNYIIRVTLKGQQVNKDGFILDYGKLKNFGTYLDETFDHRHMNDFLDWQPSSENLCKYLVTKVRELCPIPEGTVVAVSVSETPRSWAEWSE